MTVEQLLAQAKHQPEQVDVKQVIQVIDTFYQYTPASFDNGELINGAGCNETSCKIFMFAKLNQLSEKDTLALFGQFYRQDVLLNPLAKNHKNIRQFIKTGWQGIRFEQAALRAL